MEFKKIHLDDMKRCYCASWMHMFGENYYFLASEDPNVACNMYWGKNFENKMNVWTEPGGCMSIIPIPGKEGEFLAVQEFYLKVSPSQAKIVWGKFDGKEWKFKDVLHLPYIHRFDIYQVDGKNYFVGATIARLKDDKQDWTRPGQIYAGLIPDDLANEELKIEEINDGMFRNHGYWHGNDNGQDCGYFGCDQGLMKLTPNGTDPKAWKKEWLLDFPVGEVAVCDIDNDGENEIMVIKEFHGSEIAIYKNIDGKYEEVYKYDNEIEFAHTLVGTTILGQPTFVAGIRRKDCEEIMVQYIDGKFVTTVIDKGVGPANLCVVNEEDRDLIISANHTAAEAAVYVFEKEA